VIIRKEKRGGAEEGKASGDSGRLFGGNQTRLTREEKGKKGKGRKTGFSAGGQIAIDHTHLKKQREATLMLELHAEIPKIQRKSSKKSGRDGRKKAAKSHEFAIEMRDQRGEKRKGPRALGKKICRSRGGGETEGRREAGSSAGFRATLRRVYIHKRKKPQKKRVRTG